MSQPTPERREKIREAVAAGRARLAALSPAEKAAYKARSLLGEGFDPYTPEERASRERIASLTASLEAEAEALHAKITGRLRVAIADQPELATILAELETGSPAKVALKPH